MAQRPVEYVVEGGGDDAAILLLLAAAGVGAYLAYKEGWFGGGDKQEPPEPKPIPLGPAHKKKPPTLGILPGPGDMHPLSPGKGKVFPPVSLGPSKPIPLGPRTPIGLKPGLTKPLPLKPGLTKPLPLKPAPSPPLVKPLPYIGHGQCLKTGTVGLDGKIGGWAFQNQMDNPNDCKPVMPGYSQAFWGVWAGPKEGWVGKFRDTSAKACALKFENGLSACDMKNLPVSGWKNPPLGLKKPPAGVTYCVTGSAWQDYEHGANWTWDTPVLSKAPCPPNKDQASFFGTYKAGYHYPEVWTGTISDPYGNCAKSFGCNIGSLPNP